MLILFWTVTGAGFLIGVRRRNPFLGLIVGVLIAFFMERLLCGN